MPTGKQFVVVAIWLLAAPGCSRERVRAGADATPSAVSSVATAPSAASSVATAPSDFRSERHAFSVRYPGARTPTMQDLGTVESAIGPVRETSYFSGSGAATFDVTVAVYPAGRLSPDTAGLLKVMRDTAVANPAAKLVAEQPVTLRTSTGKAVEGRLAEFVMSGEPAFLAWCFHENRGYTLAAAGKAGPTLNRQAFEAFVNSFRVLDGVDL